MQYHLLLHPMSRATQKTGMQQNNNHMCFSFGIKTCSIKFHYREKNREEPTVVVINDRKVSTCSLGELQ